jgi:hypothetical protein
MIATAQKVHCRECNEWKDLPISGMTAVKLIALQLCYDCEFWHRLEILSDHPSSARIGGKHYWIGRETSLEEDPPKWRGMAGARAIIQFNDGRTVTTTNLWYQGVVPERWIGRLPNNARFVKQK